MVDVVEVVDVVDGGAVVDVVEVVDDVVVPPKRHSLMSGSGWPTSNAITSERP